MANAAGGCVNISTAFGQTMNYIVWTTERVAELSASCSTYSSHSFSIELRITITNHIGENLLSVLNGMFYMVTFQSKTL